MQRGKNFHAMGTAETPFFKGGLRVNIKGFARNSQNPGQEWCAEMADRGGKGQCNVIVDPKTERSS